MTLSPSKWHHATAAAVLDLVDRIEDLERGQGWDLDDELTVWRLGDVFYELRRGQVIVCPARTAAAAVSRWLVQRKAAAWREAAKSDQPLRKPVPAGDMFEAEAIRLRFKAEGVGGSTPAEARKVLAVFEAKGWEAPMALVELAAEVEDGAEKQ